MRIILIIIISTFLDLLNLEVCTLVGNDFFHKKVFYRFLKIDNFHICDELALRYDGKSITDSFDIREDMRIEKESFSLSLEFQHEVFYHFPSYRVESAHRLIEKYDLWIMED